ncbi:MAG: HAD family hydrolase [Promethearchaeota archaeon]
MQIRNPIKAIVWDLDGTIVHFKINSIKARKSTINILNSYGIEKENLSTEKSILDNLNISKEILTKRGHNSNQIKTIFEEVDDVISKIEFQAALNASMIEGIEEVLSFARKKDLKQAIYTFNKSKHAKLTLEKVKLLKFFEVIIGRDNVDNPKPHPDHLLTICDKLKVNPNEILVIGDNFRDIEGALNVGAYSIAVHNKLVDIKTLQKADLIVREKEIPQKMIEVIEKLL